MVNKLKMWSLLYAIMVLYIPTPVLDEFDDLLIDQSNGNGYYDEVIPDGSHDQLTQFQLQGDEADEWQLPLVQWFEEQLHPDLKLSFALNRCVSIQQKID